MALDEIETRRRLAGWLEQRLVGASGVEVGAMTPTSAGFSAQTLMFEASYVQEGVRRERALVMRKEMPGPAIFLDTDLLRQGEMMTALARHGVPTTPLVAMEGDETVLGSRFLVTDRVAGRPFPPTYHGSGWVFDLPAEARGRLWRNAVETIGRLNRLDWREGFQALNKPRYGAPGLDQYLAWLRAWRAEAAGGGPHPILDPAMDYLAREKPANPHVDVLWGDSNPGNMLFADDLSVAAVLDFEAQALGPGEIDLGWWLFMDESRGQGSPPLSGVPDRAQTVAIYEAALGRAVGDLAYFELMAAVRMSLVIVRTIDRLIEMGRLEPGCTGGLGNPFAGALATKLGLEPPPVGEGFAQFVRAVSQR